MVNYFGNSFFDAYTSGVPVDRIYTKGELVWKRGQFYISWLPSDASGSFTMFDSEYNMEDYNGYFSDFNCYITSEAFANLNTISYVDTNAYIVLDSAFKSCSSLSQVSMSECVSIGASCFYTCRSLTDVYLPKCEIVGRYAFNCCVLLTSISFPNCKYVYNRAFAYCESLNYVNLPNCLYVGPFAFSSCQSLETVNLPNCSHVNYYAFYGGHNLSDIGLQKCEIVDEAAFAYCYMLSEISLPKCRGIGPGAFVGCFTLKRVTINASSVCTLGSIGTYVSALPFVNTPIEAGSGYIYVPYSLVDSYKTAPNWSVYKNQILPIQ